MTSKPTVLIDPDYFGIFHTTTFEEFWREHINIEHIDLDKTYDPNSTIIVVDWLQHRQTAIGKIDGLVNVRPINNSGIKMAIINTYDVWDGGEYTGEHFYLRAMEFSWFVESLNNINRQWHQLDFTKTTTPEYNFLLLMNLRRPGRDMLWRALGDQFNENICSYQGRDIPLQNAHDAEYSETWERHLDTNWYKNTHYSIVSETNYRAVKPGNSLHVTEKSYKPFFSRHPMITWGQTGTLEYFKNLGFATFDDIIDQSYDTIVDDNLRLEAIMSSVDQLNSDTSVLYSTSAQEQIEHNFNLFYNTDRVELMMKQQMLDPLLEFING